MHRSLESVSVLIRVSDAVLLTCWSPLGKSPLLLQKASIKIIDTNTCNSEEAYGGRIVDTMLCAGYLEGSIDACQVSLETIHKDHRGYKQLLSFC
jgi:hypothetical protein